MTIRIEEADLPVNKLPSEFHSLKYHYKTLQILMRSYETDTLSHALLFTGMKGIGKLAAARFFSMVCNCNGNAARADSETTTCEKSVQAAIDSRPCGCCRSCRKIVNGTHPDILLLDPAGKQIKIDQIRGLVQTLSMKPYEAAQRFAIISDADSMTPEAGNALLKVLEEPPDRTTIILTAGQTSDLLSTIVSRCLHLRMKPLPAEYISEVLENKHGAQPAEAKALAGMSWGSLTRGEFMKANGWLEKRSQLIHQLVRLRHRPAGYIMTFAEKLSRNRDVLNECLEVLKLWFRDLIVYPYTPDRIMFHDLMDLVREECRQFEPGALSMQIDRIHEVQKKLEYNGNARLLTETLLMKMAGQ